MFFREALAAERALGKMAKKEKKGKGKKGKKGKKNAEPVEPTRDAGWEKVGNCLGLRSISYFTQKCNADNLTRVFSWSNTCEMSAH